MDWTIKDEFYNNNLSCNLEEYQKQRSLHNDKFLKTVDVSNVFNRLVLYNTTDFHKENILFGKKINDSRLTQVFFVHLDCESHPVNRISKNSKI